MRILIVATAPRSDMADDLDRVPAEPLDAIAYLSRSANRVRILDALASGAFDRRALGEATDVAPTTVGRIVNELEERGWAERSDDGTYVATARGRLVAEEFAPLIEAMDAILTLGEAVDWLPVDELSVGIRHFRDATIWRSTANAPIKTIEHLADRIRAAETFRALSFLAPPSPAAEAIEDGVVDGDLTIEFVLAGGLVDFLRSEDDSSLDWSACIAAGGRIYRYGGRIPCHLFVLDETALVMGERPAGPASFLESDDETVLDGVLELFETYRDEAEVVDPEVFE